MTLAWLECGYRNSSDRMVIVRCVGPEAFFLERVVFPFELLSFACPPESEVKIWTHGLGGPELLESIPVEELLSTPDASASAADAPLEERSASPAAHRPSALHEGGSALHTRGGRPAMGGGDLVQAWVSAV